jgi:hypothetical protein
MTLETARMMPGGLFAMFRSRRDPCNGLERVWLIVRYATFKLETWNRECTVQEKFKKQVSRLEE